MTFPASGIITTIFPLLFRQFQILFKLAGELFVTLRHKQPCVKSAIA